MVATKIDRGQLANEFQKDSFKLLRQGVTRFKDNSTLNVVPS